MQELTFIDKSDWEEGAMIESLYIEKQKNFLDALKKRRESLAKKDNVDAVIIESLDEVISNHSTLLEVMEEDRDSRVSGLPDYRQ